MESRQTIKLSTTQTAVSQMAGNRYFGIQQIFNLLSIIQNDIIIIIIVLILVVVVPNA